MIGVAKGIHALGSFYKKSTKKSASSDELTLIKMNELDQDSMRLARAEALFQTVVPALSINATPK